MSKNLDRLRWIIRKVAEESGGDPKAATRRVLMWVSTDQSLEEATEELIVEKVCDHLSARNLDLSTEEISDKAIATLKQGPEAVEHILRIHRLSRQAQLDAALWDVAIDLHPDWKLLPNGRCRYIGKGRRPSVHGVGPGRLLGWLYKNHPSRVQAIKQYYSENKSESVAW
jgi:hypothetical protein